MPLYQVRCQGCDEVSDIWRKIADRDLLPRCECGGRQQREIVAPAVFREFEEYISPVSGKVISSRNQRREDLTATGSIEYEPGIKEQIERRRQDLIREDEKKLDTAIDNVVCALNASGRFDNATE